MTKPRLLILALFSPVLMAAMPQQAYAGAITVVATDPQGRRFPNVVFQCSEFRTFEGDQPMHPPTHVQFKTDETGTFNWLIPEPRAGYKYACYAKTGPECFYPRQDQDTFGVVLEKDESQFVEFVFEPAKECDQTLTSRRVQAIPNDLSLVIQKSGPTQLAGRFPSLWEQIKRFLPRK
jgi:hypothetical protein